MKNFFRAASALLPLALLTQLAAASSGFPGMLVEVNSEEGQARLARASIRADFDPLAYHFEAQTDHRLSGLASAAMVLNALRPYSYLRPPLQSNPGKSPVKLPLGVDPFYYRYTQQTLFESDTDKASTLRSGFALRKYAKTLRAHRLNVQLRIADDSLTDQQIRSELISNLAQHGNFVIINYNRIALGQLGSGHISPLGAYDEKSDSFLILDVNPSVAPWVWVKSADLITAMRTRDRTENRGYVLVSDQLRTSRTTASK
jgi:hypothetical protein